MRLIDDVLFLEDPDRPGYYHPRISAQHTHVYHSLDEDQKSCFNRLYDDFITIVTMFLERRGVAEVTCSHLVDRHAGLWRRFGNDPALRSRSDGAFTDTLVGNPTNA